MSVKLLRNLYNENEVNEWVYPHIYCDRADLEGIKKTIEEDSPGLIQGFTTNPTLMKQAGVTDYCDFSIDVIQEIKKNKPNATLSLEVFSDDFSEMSDQALYLDNLAKSFDFNNLYIKIPITNSKGESSEDLVARLSFSGVKVNVTAVFTREQVVNILRFLSPKTKSFISIFAGRIADAGIFPEEYFNNSCLESMKKEKNVKFLWASPREVLHFDMAKKAGFDIITMTPSLIEKLKENRGKDLIQFSLETCQMFRRDAEAAGYVIC